MLFFGVEVQYVVCMGFHLSDGCSGDQGNLILLDFWDLLISIYIYL